MKVNVDFAVCIDVIEFKEFMGNNIDKYKECFERWYFEETLIDGVPVYHHQLKYKYFNAEPIVDWLNEVAPKCNARIVATDIIPGKEDTSLPYMYF